VTGFRLGAKETTAPTRNVVGLMTHFATADEADQGFAREQIERFRPVIERFPGVPAHMANSAATFALPDALFDAVRCGVALYGLSPFGDDPFSDGKTKIYGSWGKYYDVMKYEMPRGSFGAETWCTFYRGLDTLDLDPGVDLAPVQLDDSIRAVLREEIERVARVCVGHFGRPFGHVAAAGWSPV
jgi:hypothetical protein